MLVLIIGTGAMGRKHIQDIQRVRDIQVVNPNMAFRFAFLRKDAYQDELSLSLEGLVCSSMEQALKLNPACAIISTPPAMHFEVLVPLIKANIPFYIEKPVVTERSELNHLKSLLETHKFTATTMVGHNLRFLHSLAIIKDGIQNRILGNIIRANFQAGLALPLWRKTPYSKRFNARKELGGGVLFDFMHELDLVRWLLGEFDLIHAIGGHFSSLNISSDDVACIILGKKNHHPPIVSINLDYVSQRLIRRYEIIGEEATFRWDLPTQKLELISQDSITPINCGESGFDVQKTYQIAMKEFILSALANMACSLDIREGLKSVELALQIKEAYSS